MSGVRRGFAVWITGLPSAGKSTLTAALVKELGRCGVVPEVLESDELRKVLTPDPVYSEKERDAFYSAMLHIGVRFVSHGISVVFDATANRRAYRERARAAIERFLEVYVETPLPACEARDPKGIYRRGREGGAPNVPGISAAYEPPADPEIRVRGDIENPEDAARRVARALRDRGWIAG